MMPGLLRFPLAALLLQRAAGLRAEFAAKAPKVYYLFLANDGVYHEDIWADYFSQGVQGSNFEAFVHCTDSQGCHENIKHKDIFSQIATVPSQYCKNLIDPMLALLAAAYNASNRQDRGMDKYVFLSDTTLPVKAFGDVQRTLIDGNEGLAFFGATVHKGCYKASQWSVLSRPQVSRILDFARQPVDMQDRRGCLRATDGDEPSTRIDDKAIFLEVNESVQHETGACVDEYWPMMATFGRKNSWRELDEDLMESFRNRDFTWVDWRHSVWSASRGSVVLASGPVGPATIVAVTKAGLWKLAGSDYLFMRKVRKGTIYEDTSMTLREAFRKFVFEP